MIHHSDDPPSRKPPQGILALLTDPAFVEARRLDALDEAIDGGHFARWMPQEWRPKGKPQ